MVVIFGYIHIIDKKSLRKILKYNLYYLYYYCYNDTKWLSSRI